MQLRYHIDRRTEQPHIYGYNVAEGEVEEVLARPLEDRPGQDDAIVALGQTAAGRYLRVIDVPDPVPESVFVITAYEIGPKAHTVTEIPVELVPAVLELIAKREVPRPEDDA